MQARRRSLRVCRRRFQRAAMTAECRKELALVGSTVSVRINRQSSSFSFRIWKRHSSETSHSKLQQVELTYQVSAQSM